MLENTDVELTGIDTHTTYHTINDRRTGLSRIISTDVDLTWADKPTGYMVLSDCRPKFVEYVRVFDELFESKVLLVNSEG